MTVELYKTRSEKNRLYKDLRDKITLTGTLKDETSIFTPSIQIESTTPLAQYNYMWFEYFQRWYFITAMTVVRANLWRAECKVDVLMSFRDDILKSTALLNTSSTPTTYNKYITSGKYVSTVKSKTDIVQFPDGLSDTGEWILVTAAGS